jgi:outer membrane protein assembly factor BamB
VDGTRSALIIASDQYADPGLQRLRAPASDARALAAVLRDPGIGDFEVRTLLNEPAHVVNLAVEEFFADRQPGDLLLLHFSGHGIKDQDGELYFAAPNTVLGRLGATAVAADFVSRRMSRSRSRRVVLLLDCCYAGAFERGLVARAGTEVGIEQQFGGRGRAVITASSAMEYAFEAGELTGTPEVPPSVFTSALVQGLETGDADRDQDGLVGLDELYDYVYDKVRAATPSQTPGKWTFGMEGELHIARRGHPVTTPAPLPPELRQAIESPLAGVRAGAVQELAVVLRGSHAGRALAARLALEQLTNDDSRAVAAAATAALVAPAFVPPPAPEADAAAHPEPAPEALAPAAAEPGQQPDLTQVTPSPVTPSPVAADAIPSVAEAPPRDDLSPVPTSGSGPGAEPPPEPRPRQPGRRRSLIIVSSAVGAAVIGLVVAIILISRQPHASTPPGASGSSQASTSNAPVPLTSRLRWTYTTKGQVWSSPAVADGMVYVGSDDGNVYALNAGNGKSVWSYHTGGMVRSSPVVASGMVYVGSFDGNVYALNASNGKPVWSYQTGSPVESSPAVSGGIIYVGSDNGRVYALDAATAVIQRLVWEYQTGAAVRSGPVVSGGVVYVGSKDRKVYALFAASTAANRYDWSYLTGNWVVPNPSLTVAGGTVYVGSRDDNLYAIGAAQGNSLWSYLTGGWVDSRPVVAGDTVYVGSNDDNIYAVDTATHQRIWAKNIGGLVVSGPAVAGDTLYAGSDNDKVYALNTTNGDIRWTYTTGNEIFSSPVVADGIVYIGGEDGKVYAFNTVL